MMSLCRARADSMSSGCSLVRSEKQQEVWISNRLNVKSEGGHHELRVQFGEI